MRCADSRRAAQWIDTRELSPVHPCGQQPNAALAATPDSRTPPARNQGCHLSGCPEKPYRRLVHRPRVDQHTTLVVTTSRNTLRIAWATHPVPVIDTRPTGLVLADDAVAVVVANLGGIRVIAADRVDGSSPVRCGCEAERQACAER